MNTPLTAYKPDEVPSLVIGEVAHQTYILVNISLIFRCGITCEFFSQQNIYSKNVVSLIQKIGVDYMNQYINSNCRPKEYMQIRKVKIEMKFMHQES